MTDCVKKYTSKEDICVSKLQVHMSKTNKLDISEVNPVKEEKSRPGDYVRDSDQNVNIAKGESIPSVHHTKQRTESKSNANTVEKSDSKLKKWKKRMRFQPKNVTAMQDPPHEYFKKLMSSNAVTDVELPRVVSVMEHASAAANEIKAMMSAIKQHSGNKTALQILPRHMRRRSAAHNIKRLPRRLRELAQQQALQGGDVQNKKVCRRKRRRKADLQKEYDKRAGKSGWLENHMWHAKRFHMSDVNDPMYSLWDHRVAIYPNDKCFRACYRAAAHHCLIQDISFYKCLQLSINLEARKELFELLLECGNSGMLESVKCGQCEGNILLYDRRSKLPELIGPASYMCQTSNCEQLVWLWLHPTIFQQTTNLLSVLSVSSKVTITDISSELLRFQLSGPKSSVTLLSVLHPFKSDTQTAESTLQESPLETSKITDWICNHPNNMALQSSYFTSALKVCHKQHFCKAWRNESSKLEQGQILPLIVNDPRLTLPIQKSNPSFKDLNSEISENTDRKMLIDEGSFASETTLSPLWDPSLRNEASGSRLPDHIVSTRKNQAKFSNPEESEKYLKELARPVPVILIRRSGFQNSASVLPQHQATPDNSETKSLPPRSFGAGWDLIMPAKWATAFWIPLIYHQARAGGLREQSRVHLEYKKPFFPRDYPECQSGANYWDAVMKEKKKVYYRKPPAKRANYYHLASPFPFAPCWQHIFDQDVKTKLSVTDLTQNTQILNECSNEQNKEINLVKIDKNGLDKTSTQKDGSGVLKGAMSGVKREAEDNSLVEPSKKIRLDDSNKFEVNIIRSPETVSNLEKWLSEDPFSEKLDAICDENCFGLVCVRLTVMNKGTPTECSMLCVPSGDDLKILETQFKDLYGKGLANCLGPVEEPHPDSGKQERKRSKQVKKEKLNKSENSKSENPCTFPVFPSRKICGFLTSGDYLFSSGFGGGVGFLALRDLIKIHRRQVCNDWLKYFVRNELNSSGTLVLMRNPEHKQYRYALVEINK